MSRANSDDLMDDTPLLWFILIVIFIVFFGIIIYGALN